jgi:hypothetical protein
MPSGTASESHNYRNMRLVLSSTSRAAHVSKSVLQQHVFQRNIRYHVEAAVPQSHLEVCKTTTYWAPIQAPDPFDLCLRGQHQHIWPQTAAAATAATAASVHNALAHRPTPCQLLLLLLLDLAGLGTSAAAEAALASKLSAMGCCCGAHCDFGGMAGMLPVSVSHSCTMLLAVGGTRACSKGSIRRYKAVQGSTRQPSRQHTAVQWQQVVHSDTGWSVM